MKLNNDMFGMSLGERLSVLLGVACLLIAVGVVIAGCSGPVDLYSHAAPQHANPAQPAR